MHRIEAQAGVSLHKAISDAVWEAIDEYGVVELVFNDVVLTVHEGSVIEDIMEIYLLKRKCNEYERKA